MVGFDGATGTFGMSLGNAGACGTTNPFGPSGATGGALFTALRPTGARFPVVALRPPRDFAMRGDDTT
jgi:hypothetical protein